ncbi:hypothetical protein GCM10020358_32030 [Amorphoplanes nipponensis]|uniref:Uncharacterized protein n=1 Tax=Actinoplanes nipponensis TaxID=135950 RepID=A0A919MN61_9ACTN|nr:hypothetical protein [Actinoplanes nipponensis]GIE51246.1 hypothetical protein Ani05nite_47800 [Actinoplanes nipponensis]
MSIGSLSSSTVSTGMPASTDPGQAGPAREADAPTIADHVAAAAAREPVRSVSATLGTLVDTYL